MKFLFSILALSATLVSAVPDISALTFSCELPKGADNFSVITKEDATIGAHNNYKGFAIGGTLIDPKPNNSKTVDRTQSYINVLQSPSRYNFNGGSNIGTNDSPVYFEDFETLARQAKDFDDGTYKVVVLSSGGTFNTYDFRPGGQGEDNGKTLVIFNTDEPVTLTKTPDGRQFGPSVIAPFSHVEVLGEAGFVDGLVVAKSFATVDGSQPASNLQLHADHYQGGFSCEQGRGSGGDPHFRTWHREPFSFHHQCDLVLLKTANTSQGVEVLIRTTAKDFYSSISAVAIRMGDDVLEIAKTYHALNGVQQDATVAMTATNLVMNGREMLVMPRPDALNEHDREYHLPITDSLTAVIRVHPRVIDVRFHGDDATLLEGSKGIMGDYRTGERLSRDGTTSIEDIAEYGQEWQVNPNQDSQLFSTTQSPQWPEKCTPPPMSSDSQRLLRGGGKGISKSQAQAACEGKHASDIEDCIFDVMATGDLSLAYAF